MLEQNELNKLALQAKTDKEAEERLYQELSGLIFLLAGRRKIQGLERDDIFQEGFMALQGAVESYDEKKGNFQAYVRACVENRMTDAARAAGRDKNKPLNSYISIYTKTEEGGDLVDKISASGESIDEQMIEKEQLDELKKRIEVCLTELEKNVLQEYLDGLSYREIGLKLGQTAKSVDNSLSKIKKKLRETK